MVSEYRTSDGGIALVQNDITQQRKAERLLSEAVESLSEGFALYDENDCLALFNKRYVELYETGGIAIEKGRSYEGILREAIALGQFPDAIGEEDAFVASRIAIHRNPPQTSHQLTPDGRWIRVTEYPTPSGGIGGLRVDITEEKIALQQAIESKSEMAALVEIAPEGVISLDSDMNIILFNRGAERVFGYEASEVIGASLNQLIPTRFHSNHFRHVEKFSGSEDETILMKERGQIYGQHKDGHEFPAEASVSKIQLGDRLMFTVIIQDITSRMESERLIIKAREDAEIANRAKTEFLANMSHELRTPLNAVIGFSEVLDLEIYGPINEQQKERLGDINRAGSHLLSLISDILDLSKIEAGKFDLALDDVDVQKVVDSSLQLIAGRADQANVSISTKIPEVLPILHVDERLLKQMLINLLSNAVKFTPAGGKIVIEVMQPTEGGMEISVLDNGIGMDEESLPKAMASFGQISSSQTRNHEGTGLGLPLVKSFMELHDGKLEIESEPAVGTVVRLIFPAGRVG